MEVVRDSRWKELYEKYDNGNRDKEILVRLANYWWTDEKRAELRAKAKRDREERCFKF